MKLQLEEQSKTRHCFLVVVKGEAIARTACFIPKNGPGALIKRLNVGVGGYVGTLIGAEQFGFEIKDPHGVLLESVQRSKYRNLMMRYFRLATDLLDSADFKAPQK